MNFTNNDEGVACEITGKVIIIGDLNLSAKQPASRVDEYLNSVLNNIDHLIECYHNREIDLVIICGNISTTSFDASTYLLLSERLRNINVMFLGSLKNSASCHYKRLLGNIDGHTIAECDGLLLKAHEDEATQWFVNRKRIIAGPITEGGEEPRDLLMPPAGRPSREQPVPGFYCLDVASNQPPEWNSFPRNDDELFTEDFESQALDKSDWKFISKLSGLFDEAACEDHQVDVNREIELELERCESGSDFEFALRQLISD